MKNMEFRAWDGEQFLYLDLNNVEPDINIEWLLLFFRLPKQQYTGLKDKNGKEIYKGDIVESGNGRIWLVKFGEYKYALNAEHCIGWYLHSGSCQMSLSPNLRIIGNEFENPELLEQI